MALSVRALLMQRGMSDPASAMGGCGWADGAVYTKGLPEGDFEHLEKLAEEANGDLSVAGTSDLQ